MSKSNNNFIFSTIFLSVMFVVTMVVSPSSVSAYTTPIDSPYWDGVYYTPPQPNLFPAVPNPVPVIGSLSPNEVARGSGAKTVIITGSGFAIGSSARFNGAERPTTFIDRNTLEMKLSATDTATDGNFIVTVFNPSPAGGSSNVKFFTVSGGSPIVTSTTNTNTVIPVNTVTYVTNPTTTYVQTPTTTVVRSTPTVTRRATTTTVARTNTTNNNVITNGADVNNGTATVSKNSEDNSLAANAIFGDGSFLPNTLAEWLLLAILILLAVVLWRRIWVTDAQRNAPLKHA
jgi:hypothetical protein